MNVNDMLIFAEVVERGGFTAAGDSLGKPKSNISRTVSRLESALGVTLLERTTRHHTLTDIGKIYYSHCVRIKEEIESANSSIETLSESPCGLLRVSASVTVGQTLIGPKLGGFIHAYPDVQLDLRLINRRVNLLEENFDVLIRVGSLEDSSLVARHLCTRALHWYVSPNYLKQHSTPKEDLSDLASHPCLFMNAVSENAEWIFRRGSQKQRFQFKPSFACDDFIVLKQRVLEGAGIGKLPDYMCEDLERNGQLVRVLNTWQGPQIDFHAIVASRKGMTPKIKAFLDYLKDAFSES